MESKSERTVTRGGALKQLIVLPALAAFVGTSSIAADAADNKKQFNYQDKPDAKTGRKCSGCQLFKPPHSCAVVTGTISPNGWCKLWAPKAH